MALKNKLTTLGYFIKRLKDNNFYVIKLFNAYSYSDPRAWTVMIDPGNASIVCTCYLNKSDFKTSYFELYDGDQFIKNRINLKTSSIETFIEYLFKCGAKNNAPDYNRANDYTRS